MADLLVAIKIATEDASSGPIDRIKGAFGGLASAITTGPTKAIGGLISGLGSIGLAAQGLSALATGAASIATGLVSGNAEMETFRTQLGTMMGSTDAATDRIKQLAKIGADTPFELPQLVAAEKIMMGFGLNTEKTMKLTGKSLDEYRTSMGDMAAGTGTDLSEITNLWAKFGSGATGESLARLQELGIVTKEQLAEVGIQFSKSGELLSPLPEAMSAAMRIADEKFGGGMKALSATFDGQMSTLSDNFNQAKTLLTQPIFDVLKTGLVGVNEFLSSSTFQTGLTTFAEAGAAAITKLITVFGALGGVFQGTDETLDTLYEGLEGIASDDTIGNIINIVYGLGETFRAVMQGDIPAAVAGVTQLISDAGTLLADLFEEWAGAFAGWIDGADSEMMGELGLMVSGVYAWLFESSLAIIEKLGGWAAAFVDWIGPKVPDMLRELGAFAVVMLTYITTDALPLLVTKLAEWGTAFVAWIAPKIPPLLLEAGKLLLELGGWLIGTALPAIVGQLAEWAGAFVAWVAPAIPPLLLALAGLLGDLVVWAGTVAMPAIVAKMAEWAGAFVDWIATDVLPALPAALETVYTAVTGWAGEKLEGVKSTLSGLGAAMVQGIQEGAAGALGGLWNWLQTEFIDPIPEFVKKLLKIASPSGVFEDIGSNIVAGLRVGLESNLPSVAELIRSTIGDLGGEVGDSGGKVKSYIANAAAERGIDPSVALRVAKHEGGEDDYMRIGKFDTGWSFWPFQLHYGGSGYEHFGTVAGMGNNFTKKTGLQPGDWRAWDESTDYALDHASKHGWGAWYGRKPAGVGEWEGITGYADGGWITEPIAGIGMRSGRGYRFGEGGQDELVTPRAQVTGGGRGGDTFNFYGVQPESVLAEAERRQRRAALLQSVRRA